MAQGYGPAYAEKPKPVSQGHPGEHASRPANQSHPFPGDEVRGKYYQYTSTPTFAITRTNPS
jgi:hypothetical protein